jgi:hypothetical protein
MDPNTKEPSKSELDVALKLYDGVQWGITNAVSNIHDIYKLYLTVSTTLLSASLVASGLGRPYLVYVCCITPCLSLPFAKWREVQSIELIDFANFVRTEFDSYIKRSFPNLRSERLPLLSWTSYTLVAESHKEALRQESWVAILVIHFPSALSLFTATVVLMNTVQIDAPAGHCHGLFSCEARLWYTIIANWPKEILKNYRLFFPVLFSFLVWVIALRISWYRIRILFRGLDKQAEHQGDLASGADSELSHADHSRVSPIAPQDT